MPEAVPDREADADVLIVGGGPVGLALAVELGQRGRRVTVVERHATIQPIPKGQNLTQRTMEHMRAWGCEDALRAAHDTGGGIGGMTSYGTLLSGYHYDWLNRAKVARFYHAANHRLPQYETEGVLRDRAAALPSVTTLYGWTGTAASQDADGVTVEVQETDGDGRRTLRAAWAVACDGARSFLRQAAGIGETRSDHDRKMALLVFTSTELHALLERYPGKAFYNVLHPDFEGYWQFFGRVDHGRTWFFHAPVPPGTTEDHDFEGFLHRAVGQPFDLTLDYVGFWDLRIATADAYRSGRVFVAGDAAHSHPPYGGYGINTGFEDARNLGWKLDAAIAGWGTDGLLDSYGAERRPVFRSTARDFIERFIEEDRAFLTAHSPDDPDFEKRWGARNADAEEVLAFEPHYEGSPVVAGDGTPSARGSHRVEARAGHHLSPAEDGTMPPLGPGFTLLAPNAEDGPEGDMPLDVVPGDWAPVYGAPFVLVRPDGFVAWAGGAEAAAGMLSRAVGRPA